MVHPQNMVSKRNLHFKVTENYACSMCPFSVKSIDLLRSHHLSAHGTTEGDKGNMVTVIFRYVSCKIRDKSDITVYTGFIQQSDQNFNFPKNHSA